MKRFHRRFPRCLRCLRCLPMAALLFAATAHAAQPGSGTLQPTNSPSWTGGPYQVGVPNQLGCVLALNPTIGHLMGVHHHYANCVEGNLASDGTGDLSPCTLMFNFVEIQSVNFGILEGLVARGHAVQFASP